MYLDTESINAILLFFISFGAALVIASVIFLVSYIIKKTPQNISNFLTNVAKAFVLLTIFKQLALFNIDLYFYKSVILTASMSAISFAALTLVFSMVWSKRGFRPFYKPVAGDIINKKGSFYRTGEKIDVLPCALITKMSTVIIR